MNTICDMDNGHLKVPFSSDAWQGTENHDYKDNKKYDTCYPCSTVNPSKASVIIEKIFPKWLAIRLSRQQY